MRGTIALNEKKVGLDVNNLTSYFRDFAKITLPGEP